MIFLGNIKLNSSFTLRAFQFYLVCIFYLLYSLLVLRTQLWFVFFVQLFILFCNITRSQICFYNAYGMVNIQSNKTNWKTKLTTSNNKKYSTFSMYVNKTTPCVLQNYQTGLFPNYFIHLMSVNFELFCGC